MKKDADRKTRRRSSHSERRRQESPRVVRERSPEIRVHSKGPPFSLSLLPRFLPTHSIPRSTASVTSSPPAPGSTTRSHLSELDHTSTRNRPAGSMTESSVYTLPWRCSRPCMTTTLRLMRRLRLWIGRTRRGHGFRRLCWVVGSGQERLNRNTRMSRSLSLSLHFLHF